MEFQLIAGTNTYRLTVCTIAGAVVIPETYNDLPVTEIGGQAFRNRTYNNIPTSGSNTRLTGVTIPASVRSIGESAFYYCTSLTGVTIPASVTYIGNGAFQGCSSLVAITVDANNPYYASEGGILYNKAKTLLIAYPSVSGNITITTPIASNAFFGTRLTGVTISDSVTAISSQAFYYCTSLTSVTIPASVTSIGDNAFRGCTRLATITVDANNSDYASQDGILYNKAKTQFIHIPIGISGAVAIPTGVTSIGEAGSIVTGSNTISAGDEGNIGVGGVAGTFQSCASLPSITIPASVTSIGSYAFFYCTSLAAITVDANNPNYASEGGILYNKAKTLLIAYPSASGSITITTSIGDTAFYQCTRLTRVTISNSVTSIGSFAFQGCTGLTSVTFQGTIAGDSFSSSNPFPGDLRAKYLAGGIGTYTRPNGSSTTWTKQP